MLCLAQDTGGVRAAMPGLVQQEIQTGTLKEFAKRVLESVSAHKERGASTAPRFVRPLKIIGQDMVKLLADHSGDQQRSPGYQRQTRGAADHLALGHYLLRQNESG